VASDRRRRLLLLLALAAVGCATAGSVRRFPLREVMWHDPDQGAFAPAPEEYYSPFGWDAADQTIFRPISRFFAVDPAGEATNVNALDEVPDSSWFENRIGRFGMTPEEVERGACDGPPLDPNGPWTVKGAKPNGANPGFLIKATDGRRYLLKFDGTLQGERATTADVLGSRIYHAVGYWAPCNTVVFFTRDILTIDPEAESEDDEGNDVPLTWADVDTVLSKSYRLPDGRYRASASEFLPGRPLGPWRYQDTRRDDPNDVVPHQDRRELRGGYVLASWLNHFDTREQNTLSVWVEAPDGERGHVRHYYLDFGDCLGSLWDQEGISRRLGHAYYLDIPYLVNDALTLGLQERPWEDPHLGPAGTTLGYFGVERFVPEEYRTGYPNPAFIRASERDKAWMGRILADFGDAHLQAALRPARVRDPVTKREILRILRGRREKLLARWLSVVSPLSHPHVRPGPGGARLCLRDMAVVGGVVSAEQRRYVAVAHEDGLDAPRPLPAVERPAPEEPCVALPPVAGASADSPRYLIIEVRIERSRPGAAENPPGPLRVHLYALGGDDYRIVGLERPHP
jgi:hypothetical protein